MASTNTELLEAILNDLNIIIESSKKRGPENLKFSGLNINAAPLNAAATALGSFLYSLTQFSKINVKNVEKVSGAIETIYGSLSKIKLTKEQKESISSVSAVLNSFVSTLNQLQGGILDLLKKFNPVKAKIVGRTIGAFYKSLFEELDDVLLSKLNKANSKTGSQQVNNITSVITSLFNVDFKKIKKVGKVLAEFPKEAGQNLADFLNPILNLIPGGQGSIQAANRAKLAAETVKIVFDTLSSLSFADRISNSVNEEKGKNINKFIKSIIEGFTEEDRKSAETVSKLMNSFSAIMLALSISFGIITFIVAKNDIKYIGLGIVITLGFMVFAKLVLKMFSSKSMQTDAKNSMITLGLFTLVMLGLTAVLAATVSLAQNYSIEELGIAALIMVGMSGIMLIMTGIMKLIGKVELKNVGKSILVMGAMVLVMGAMILLTSAVLDLADRVSGMEQSDIWSTFGLMFAMIGGVLLISGLLGASKTVAASIAIGGAVLAEMVAILGLLTKVTDAYLDLVLRINEIPESMFENGLKLGQRAIKDMILLTSEVVGPLVTPILLLAAPALASLGVAIFSLKTVFSNLEEMLEITQRIKLKYGTMDEAFKDIMVMPPKLIELVDALTEMSGFAAIKAAFISKRLNPVFEMLGNFASLMEKTGNLQIISGYDANGKPIFKPMKHSDFVNAAKNIADAFGTFLTTLNEQLSGDVLDKASDIVYKIAGGAGGYPGLLTLGARLMFGKSDNRPNFGELFKILSKFTDLISTFAGGSIPVEWDKDGNPTSYKRLTEEAEPAAKQLALSFSAFLKELDTAMNPVIDSASTVIKKLTKGDIANLMQSVSNFSNAIIGFASSTIPDEWDKNGKAIHYRKIEDTEFETAAKTLASTFGIFFNTLNTEMAKNLKDINNLIDDMNDSGLDTFIGSITKFLGPVVSIASGQFKVNGEDVKFESSKLVPTATTIAKTFTTLFNGVSGTKRLRDMTNDLKMLNSIVDLNIKLAGVDGKKALTNAIYSGASVKNFIEQLTGSEYKKLPAVVNTLSKCINSLSKSGDQMIRVIDRLNSPLTKLNTLMKEMNSIIIEHSAQRIESIKNMTDEYKKMAEAVEKLSYEKDRHLMMLHEAEYQGNQFNSSLLYRLNDQFKNFSQSLIADNKDNSNASTNEPVWKPQVQINTAEIAQAVAMAIEKAMSNQKILQVSFGDSESITGILNG